MSITLEATLREDTGKGSSRRLRRALGIPAIIYGANKNPISITLGFHTLAHLLEFNEEVFTSVIAVNIGKKKESVIIKALQRHPSTTQVTHVDLLRVDSKHTITTGVQLNFINDTDNELLRLGALLNQFITNVEVVCLAKDLPNKIDVDVSDLTMETIIKLSDLVLSEGVKLKVLMHADADLHDQTVASISPQRKISDDDIDGVDGVDDVEEVDKEEESED